MLVAIGCGRVNFGALGDAGDAGDAGRPSPRYASIAAGAAHVCALAGDGTAYCWGSNRDGQLTGTIERANIPTHIDGTWSAIAASADHTCAIASGAVYCWGNNADAAVTGIPGGLYATPTPVALPALSFDRIATGLIASCAIGAGELWCWGTATATGTGVSAPTRVGAQNDWVAISIGYDFSCGIRANAGVWCWGSNDAGQVQTPPSPSVSVPASVALPAGTPIALGLGNKTSCAIVAPGTGATAGELWCWGANDDRQIDDTELDRPPTRVGTEADWTEVAHGGAPGNFQKICGIRGGVAYCWGSTSFTGAGLGNGIWDVQDIGASNRATVGPASSLALGLGFGYADIGCLNTAGAVSCWGTNFQGELGNGHFSEQATPVEVPPPSGRTWSHVVGTWAHLCAETDDGGMWCWGADNLGQISGTDGHGGASQPCVPGGRCNEATPIGVVIGGTTHDEMIAGFDFTCTRAATTINCWGRGHNQTVMTMAAPAGQWTSLVGGYWGSCGTTSTGALGCWGPIGMGSSATPTVVAGAEVHDVVQAGQGIVFMCALRGTDNARVCFGDNSFNQMGDGTVNTVATPTAYNVGQIQALAIAMQTGCALTTLGGVSCWGDNGSRQAGQASVMVPTPMAVNDSGGPLAGCTAIGLSSDHGCAVCGGRPLCWGFNWEAELGRGTRTAPDQVAAPVAVPAGTFTEISVHNGGGCTVANDGRLFCWGNGSRGQLGDGSQGFAYPIPVAAPL